MVYRSAAVLVLVLVPASKLCADAPANVEATVLGVTVVPVSDVATAFRDEKVSLPTKIGVVLARVDAHGPAAKAGLQKMDVIINIDKKAIRTVEEFQAAVKELTPGKEYELIGYRARPFRGRISWKKGQVKFTPVSLRTLLLGSLRKKTDDVRDVTSYFHVDTPEFVNSQSDLFCYFVSTKSSEPVLRLQIQYVADDWLFIRRFTIKADDKTFTIAPAEIGGVERDNGSSKIWEWYDCAVGKREREILDAIAKADHVVLRCEGDQYNNDRELSDDEIGRVRTVLQAYELLKDE